MDHQSPDPFKYFRIEARELIDKLSRGCLALERGDYDAALINELNRAAHSLKGAARLVELYPAGDIAHAMEDAFAQLQAHGTAPTPDEVTGLLGQIDALHRIIGETIGTPDTPLQGASPTEPPSEYGGGTAGPGTVVAATACLDTTPSVEAAPQAPKRKRRAQASSRGDELTRVATVTLDAIGRCAGEVLELANRTITWREKLGTTRRVIGSAAALLDETRLIAQRNSEQRTSGSTRRIRSANGNRRRIDTDKLRACADGTLREIEAGFETIGPLARRLHALTLEAKLIAVSEFSHQFDKTVRDAALEMNREVELEMTGEEVRVDRFVLHTLIEPICHLLRNAVAHGIEMPAQRKAEGKPPSGLLHLRFAKTADSFRVVVEDDGAGLNVDGIREAAGIDAGLAVTPNGAADTGDVSEFIFQPGITTEQSASHVAGRGVGLDVVRDAVQRLHGTVKVEWEANSFSRFTINVRSHLDVMDVFVVRVGTQDLLVPMARLIRACVASPEAVVNHGGADAFLLDNSPVRLVPLGSVLGINGSSADSEKKQIAVLKTSGGVALAFVVDALQGRREVVIKGVGSQIESCEVLSGAAIMSDGRPGFLLDADVLGSLAKDSRVLTERKAEMKQVEPPSVLVVDDSLTTRMLEKALLESAGYRVVLAHDGAQALGKLAEAKCDLAIIDFEMPGMNGLELADRMRHSHRLADIPMIMLTSYDDDETKRRGLAAGMQAYIVKEQLDQTAFLSTVRGLVGKA